jgi:glycosyltransferase involved in cell wall biosynthesis
MSRPRVLIWYWGRRGGGPRYALELAKRLAARDDLELFLSISRESEFYDAFKALGLPGLDVETYADLKTAALASLRLPLLRRRFLDYLRDRGIDIVYCPMTHVWNWFIAGGIRRLGIPYLLTLHDDATHKGENVLIRDLILRHEIRSAAGIITLSAWVADRLRQSGYGGPVFIIPHGPFYYDRRPAAARAFPAGRPFRLLFFGRILAYKGIGLLLDALERLRRDHPDLALTIAGSGNLGPYLDRIAGLGGIAVENRWIAESEVPDLIGAADLVVLPYTEASQSGVIASAQGLGVPVVATPVGGLAEQISEAGAGMVCDAVSGESLADAIGGLLIDRARYEAIAATITGGPSGEAWDKIADDTAAAIRTLCGGPET